jgi:Holliday junction resolvase
VIRAPASGAKARRFAVPDIVAIYRGIVYAFEVKTSIKRRAIYIPKHQVEKLRIFVERAGGRGFIAVKIIGSSGWRFIDINDLKTSRGGNYKIGPEDLAKGYKLSDLVSFAAGITSLDKYMG